MHDLPDRVLERFGLRVHQRTIERALDKVKKQGGRWRSICSAKRIAISTAAVDL